MGRVRSVAVAALATVAAVGVASMASAAEVLTAHSGNRTTALAVPLPAPARRGRIVGGRAVSDVDPDTGSQFFAKIFTRDGKGFFCGGSLVSFSHILTRAGCHVLPGDVVRVGGAKLFDGLTFKVGKVTPHPGYNPDGDVHDIAVLTLADPPSEAAAVRAGVVPVAMNRVFGRPHGFYVTGFGATDGAASTAGSLQLKHGYQPLRWWSVCNEIFRHVQLPSGALLPINRSAQVCTNYKSPTSGALCV